MVKYGSLLLDTPFEPTVGPALALVFGPPVVYSLYLLTRQQPEKGV